MPKLTPVGANPFVSKALLDAVAQVESSGNPKAVSPVGAQGLFQFMPATAKEYGIDPFDPVQARKGAERYLTDLAIKYRGSLPHTLAAWNWGLGNVDKHGLDKMPKETRNFIQRVQRLVAGASPIKSAAASERPGAAKLTPVEGNPFAPVAGAKLTPVEGNPFAEAGIKPEADPGPMDYAKQFGAGVVEGVAGLVTMPEKAAKWVSNKALDALGVPKGPDLSVSGAVDRGLKQVLPKARTAGERITRRVGTEVGGTLLPGGLVGRLGKESAISLATGLGAGLGAEAGGKTGEIIGQFAPLLAAKGGAMATRGLIRGKNPARMKQRIADAKAAGTTLTMGQASNNPVLKATEKGMGMLPGGGRIRKHVEQQGAALSGKVGQIADDLAPVRGPDIAGEQLQTAAQRAQARISAESARRYNAVDQMIPETLRAPLSQTQGILSNLTRLPPADAALAGQVIPPRTRQLQATLEQAPEMAFSTARKLRNRVGHDIRTAPFVADADQGQLRQIYGGLSADIQAAANRHSPEAGAALREADQFWERGKRHMKALEPLLGKPNAPKSPEQAFKHVQALLNDHTRLKRVVDDLTPAEKNTLSATVLDHLGGGEAWSMATLLKNWEKLPPKTRQLLFGQRAEQIGAIGQTAALQADSAKEIGSPLTQLSIQASPWLAAVAGALMGNPAALGLAAAGMGGNMIGSRLLTHPGAVDWAARQTQLLPPEAIPGLLGRISADMY